MRKRSKLHALLLSCLLCISMLPTAVFAADETAAAKNGMTITKDTTQEQLDAWAGEGAITIDTVDDVTTLTLQKDFKLGQLGGHDAKATMPITFGVYPDSQNDKMILNLNGHLIASDTMVIVSLCDLTIRDSDGSGKVLMDTSSNDKAAFEAVVNQRKLTIESGTFEAKVHSSNPTTGVMGSAVADVEAFIKGGTFIGSGSAINVKSGVTTITGGSFEATNYGIIAQKTAVVIFPAESKADVTSVKYPIVVGTQSGNTGKVTISGGNFDGTGASALVGRMGGADAEQAVAIDGGTFTQDPVAYAATEPVAQIDEIFFVGAEPIVQAAQAVSAGTSVTVLQGDVDLSDVPDDVTVKNEGDGNVTVNGQPLASEPVTTHTHAWGEPIYTWNSDYTSCSAKRECTKDGDHIETAEAVVTSEVTKPSTCSEKGERTYKAVFTQDWADEQTATAEIAATGHSYGEPAWVWSQDGKSAAAIFTCEKDNSHTVEVIAEVTGKVKTEADCTEAGTTTYTAKVTFDTQEYIATKDVADIAALDHDMGEWHIISDPNCTEKGVEKRSCSRCDYTETRDLAPYGHDWETDFTVDKEATCTEEGSKSIHCKRCDAVKEITVIPALGHHYVNGICSVCNEIDPNYKGNGATDNTHTDDNDHDWETDFTVDIDPNYKENEATNSPQTGDSSTMIVWLAVALASFGAAALLYKRQAEE